MKSRDAVRALDECDAKRLLASYGVPVVNEVPARDLDEALAAALRIGYPVALKALGVEFTHKTELGLVHLNLRDAHELRAAATRIGESTCGKGNLLVQEMVVGKREFLAGMSRDAQFGPVVSFGLGGIFTEVLADVALRICPIDHGQAHRMLDEIRARALLGPVRGMPAVDRDALARTLLALCAIANERPEILAIDINPMVVCGDRPVAVDALILLDP